MRTTLRSIAMAWFLACMATAQGAQEFPYKAYVNREEVYVRSGPGDDYYPHRQAEDWPGGRDLPPRSGRMVCHSAAGRQLCLGIEPLPST